MFALLGSGRVTFRSQKSYLKAVTAAFVQIKTCKFTKKVQESRPYIPQIYVFQLLLIILFVSALKVQIDPYLDDSVCQICNSQPGPFFCRAQVCFHR